MEFWSTAILSKAFKGEASFSRRLSNQREKILERHHEKQVNLTVLLGDKFA